VGSELRSDIVGVETFFRKDIGEIDYVSRTEQSLKNDVLARGRMLVTRKESRFHFVWVLQKLRSTRFRHTRFRGSIYGERSE